MKTTVTQKQLSLTPPFLVQDKRDDQVMLVLGEGVHFDSYAVIGLTTCKPIRECTYGKGKRFEVKKQFVKPFEEQITLSNDN